MPGTSPFIGAAQLGRKAYEGTAEFFSEIAKSLNFTAEHTENAEAPENPNND